MTRQVVLSLPWPPSVNHYWLSLRKGPMAGRVIISSKGKDYRKEVAAAVIEQRVPVHTLTGKLALWIHVLPPNNIRRDLDNLPKAVLDSLAHAGVFEDDSAIDDLRITRYAVRPGGELQIRITEIAGEATESGSLFAAVG